MFRLVFIVLFSGIANALPLDPATAPADRLGSTTLDVGMTSTLPPSSSSDWKIRPRCLFVKTGYFDPIVYPGVPNSSHHHTFVGNDNVNPDSTTESLHETGGTRCMGGIANKSSYWWPTPYDTATGKVKSPKYALLYYNTQPSSEVAEALVTVPTGLKMIAGDASNSTLEGADHYEWFCGSTMVNSGKTIPPNCSTSNDIRVQIKFPMCWDGINVDSPDHKSHMAYEVGSTGNRCPVSHPVRIPNIRFIIVFANPKTNTETAGWRLSSDNYDEAMPGGLSMHADLMSAWDNQWLDMIIANCLKAKKDCGLDLLGKDANGQAWKLLDAAPPP